MANVIAPNGAQDFQHKGGAAVTAELETVWIKSSDITPIFYGDVVIASYSSAATGGVAPYITQGCSVAPTGGLWKGVFRGCQYFSPVGNRAVPSRYWPGAGAAGTSSATGDVKAYIITDPQMRFTLQGSSVVVFGSSNVGFAVQVAVNGAVLTPSSVGGNVSNGNSGMQAGSATVPSSAGMMSAPFRLVDFYANWAPGNPLPGAPGVGGAAAGFVNGTDNTTAGQILIVEPLDWESKVL